MPPLDLRLGDVVRLRREHPCGGYDFEVVRLGADIGLRCLICAHRILLARSLLERRMSGFVSRAADPMATANLDLSGLEAPGPGPGAAASAAPDAPAGGSPDDVRAAPDDDTAVPADAASERDRERPSAP